MEIHWIVLKARWCSKPMIDGKTVPKKLVGSDDERAVSPVIGVILMVAITVILAAVIAAFVLDLSPGEPDPSAAVSVSGENSDNVTVQLQSTADGTTGIVVSPDEGEIHDSSQILTTSGASQTYPVNGTDDFTDGELEYDTEYNVYAFSGELDVGDEIGSADGIAIVESFETIESQP